MLYWRLWLDAPLLPGGSLGVPRGQRLLGKLVTGSRLLHLLLEPARLQSPGLHRLDRVGRLGPRTLQSDVLLIRPGHDRGPTVPLPVAGKGRDRKSVV